MVLRHCGALCLRWDMAVDYIESLLRKQLIAAIGKEVSPADFAEYMCFHNRKLFADGYAPVPFCFAVRRSDLHAPEGTVSIEQEVTGPGGDSNVAAPIATLVARSASPQPMSFPLNASTNVRFGGERYLHAWLSHQFSGHSGSKLSLVSRARQFSSMLVLIGRIASASTFEPKYAAVVQNKDELTIPLDLSTIPTPKEFKDAIESLSPEQQAFAKAFRAMQLESTLFGVLVIQIKPQLEKVLKLPADSLTKEIKLTQDLMQLFIKYQIPSDLLSYEDGCDADGAAVVAPTPTEKLEAVKRHVQAMHEMIAKAQEEEVAERRAEAQYRAPEVRFADTRDDEADRGVRSRGAMTLKCRSAPKKGMVLGRSMMAGKGGMPPPPACAAAAAAPLASTPQTPTQQVPQQPGESGEAAAEDTAVDYTQVPKELDRRFELLDTDGALRPTIISPGETWTKRSQKALLAAPTTSTLQGSQKQEKDAAFDLLDALTKSGALPVDHAALHIVVAATHCFDKTVTETVVQDNTNPIDKVERSTLIMASTVHQKPVAALIRQAQYSRVSSTSPMLFVEDGAA
uniref:Uncharacterized protein n=1 Tax=Alexandrium catenella TaxID=2925 RepID=A0A7S1KV23_ALECA